MKNVIIEFQFLFSSIIILLLAIGIGGIPLCFKFFKFQNLSLGVVGALGLFLVGALSTLIHFFTPLNHIFFFALCAVSAIGWDQLKKTYSEQLTLRELGLFLLIIFLYWLTGLRAFPQSDFLTYHLPIITWMHEHPIALGLANVDSRYGTWNFWFPVCAGFSAGDVLPFGLYAVNIALVAFAVRDWVKVFLQRQSSSMQKAFVLGILIIFCFFEIRAFGGGQKAPFVEFVGMIFIIWSLIYYLGRSTSENWSSLILLAGIGVVTKLSQLPLVLLILPILVSAQKRGLVKALMPAGILIATGGVFMATRTFLLSGCWVYPSKRTCLNVPWKVADNDLDSMISIIVRWGRASDLPVEDVLNTWKWVPIWFERLQSEKIIPILWISISLFLISKLTLKIFKSKRLSNPDLPSLLFLFASLAYWFLSAPTLRFGYGYVISLAALFLSPILGLNSAISDDNDSGLTIRKKVIYLFLANTAFHCSGQVFRADDFGAGTLIHPDTSYTIQKNKIGQPFIITDENLNQCGTLPFPCGFKHSFNPNVIQTLRGQWISFEKE